MEASQIYILISIIVLLIIAVLIFFVRKDKKQKPLTPLAGLAFGFVIAGIVFGENRLVCYILIGIGVFLAIVDIFFKLETNKIKFVDLLRKLGIYRGGIVKSTYKSGKDRPIEFQENGVFNSKKDLIKFKKKRK